MKPEITSPYADPSGSCVICNATASVTVLGLPICWEHRHETVVLIQAGKYRIGPEGGRYWGWHVTAQSWGERAEKISDHGYATRKQAIDVARRAASQRYPDARYVEVDPVSTHVREA